MGKFVRLSIHDDLGEYDVEFQSSSDNARTVREKLISFLDTHLGIPADPDSTRSFTFQVGKRLDKHDVIKRIKLLRELTRLDLRTTKELDDETEYRVKEFQTVPITKWDAVAAKEALEGYYQTVQVDL